MGTALNFFWGSCQWTRVLGLSSTCNLKVTHMHLSIQKKHRRKGKNPKPRNPKSPPAAPLNSNPSSCTFTKPHMAFRASGSFDRQPWARICCWRSPSSFCISFSSRAWCFQGLGLRRVLGGFSVSAACRVYGMLIRVYGLETHTRTVRARLGTTVTQPRTECGPQTTTNKAYQ